MAKLWAKSETSTHNWVEKYTVGRDRDLDHQLAEADILGSIAHAKMLAKVNLLTENEAQTLVKGLQDIAKKIAGSTFTIEDGIEDVHSQIEEMLTESLGEVGKKIHSGRSRNDQVLVALKIYFRKELAVIAHKVEAVIKQLLVLSEQHKNLYLPGYTHLQVAMPSSFGLWFGAYAESLIDDLMQLQASFRLANRNPLGSGAGYGSSFPLDRELTTELLAFEGLHQNVVYAQMGRGKTELSVAWALASVAQTIGRFAMDSCVYLSQNFGFISLPTAFTTGSSIMPHKKNPDVFEILRGKCNQLMALPNTVSLLISNLPSGYHRELQLLKESVFPALEDTHANLDALLAILPNIEPNQEILNKPIYDYLFTVDAVHDLVNQGIPFRDAYKQIGDKIDAGNYKVEAKGMDAHTSVGSMGNLQTSALESRLAKEMAAFNFDKIEKAEKGLLTD
jgi:argininosuccinate lyase